MPGRRVSIAYLALPLTLFGMSRRCLGLPSSHHFAGSLLISGSLSSLTLAAASANSPYVPVRLPAVSTPSFASTSERSTPHASAAACLRRSRADAPAPMRCGCCRRTSCEPCVLITMYSLLLRRCRLASANSVLILVQSTLSSSAISNATDVMPPWPISVCGMRSVTEPSLSITIQALISVPTAVVVDCVFEPMVAANASGIWKPSISPPPTATEAWMNERRDRICLVMSASLCLRDFGGAADRLHDPLIGSATAKIVGHRSLDLRERRILALGDQGGGRHDLTALAIAALRDPDLHPGLLDRMRAVGREPLDVDDALANRGQRRQLARFHRLAVDMNGAGATTRNAAPVFGAGEPDIVAQDPEERGLRLDVHRLGLIVDVQDELHECVPS